MRSTYIRYAIFFLLICIFSLSYLVLLGNIPNRYYDFIPLSLAEFSRNKIIEMILAYLLPIVSAIGCCWIYLTSRKKDVINIEPSKLIFSAVSICVAGHYLFYGSGYTSPILAFLLTFVCFAYIKDKSRLLLYITYFFTSLYTIYAVHRIYSLFGNHWILNPFYDAQLLCFICVVTLYIPFLRKNIGRIILFEQFVIPFLMLVFVANKYKLPDETFEIIDVLLSVKVFVYSIIIFALVEAYRKIKKYYAFPQVPDNLITIGTCIAIAGYNLYDIQGSIMVNFDLRHNLENIIGYIQIFKHGLIPFENYIPITGMFSVLHGAFFQLFGNSQLAYYNVSEGIFYLTTFIISIVLLWRRIPYCYVFLISCCYYVIHYNRTLFILPVFLLLTDDFVLKHKSLWLGLWIMTTFFHVLYYPLFGVAVGIGFLPLAVYQVVSYCKSGALSSDIKKVSFWIGCMFCVVPIVALHKFLFGMIKYIKLMSVNNILHTGVPRVGLTTPYEFLNYLDMDNIFRLVSYYLLPFLVPALFIGILSVFILKLSGIRLGNKKFNFEKLPDILSLLALIIIFFISMSSLVARLEPFFIYARGINLLFATCIILLVCSYKYLVNNFNKLVLFLLIMLVPITSGLLGFGIRYPMFETSSILKNSKKQPYFSVTDAYFKDPELKSVFGNAYLSPNFRYVLYPDTPKKSYCELNSENTFYGGNDYQLPYICGFKTVASIETIEVRTYETAQANINILKKELPVIVPTFHSLPNYYLYHWIYTSGYYIFDYKNEIFVPNKENLPMDEVRKRNKKHPMSIREANPNNFAYNHLGKSYKYMADKYKIKDIKYKLVKSNNIIDIRFESPLYGDDADFLYIKFKDIDKNYAYFFQSWYHPNVAIPLTDKNRIFKPIYNKVCNKGYQIIFYWYNGGKMYSERINLGDGELLVPLGANPNWLLNENKNLYIRLLNKKQTLKVPDIEEIKFLKLREVN